MKFNEKKIDDIIVLEIEGNILGGDSAEPLSTRFAELMKAGNYKVVLDLSNANWINIAGLGLMMGGFTAMRNHKGDLKLAAANERIHQQLGSANYLEIFDYHADVDAAVASF